MKKIFISPSSQKENIYAWGSTNEQEQCNKIAKACVEYLRKCGFDCYTDYNSDMYKRVSNSNKLDVDIHIAIHTNATPKHNVTGGTQILLYALDGERYKLGTEIFKTLSAITPGKSAEKVIAKSDFYEIKKTNAICIYIECEFHDTVEGATYIVKNVDNIGKEIARGICNYYGVSFVGDTKKYVVRLGTFTTKKYAENMRDQLKKLGYKDAYIEEV